MTVTSLIVARWIAVYRPLSPLPPMTNALGEPFEDAPRYQPTVERVIQFCRREFEHLPSMNVARQVVALLDALAKEAR